MNRLAGAQFVIAAGVAMVMMAPDFGFSSAAGNHVARLAAQARPDEARDLFRAMLLWLPLLCAATAVACILLAVAIGPRSLGIAAIDPAEFIVVVSLLAAATAQVHVAFLFSPVYRIAGRNARQSIVYSAAATVEILGGAAVIVLGGRPVHVAIYQLLARCAMLAWFWIDARAIGPDLFARQDTRRLPSLRPFSGLSAAAAGQVSAPVAGALQTHGLVLAAGLVLSPAIAGQFLLLRTLANAVKNLVTLVSIPVGQELPVLLGRGQIETVRNLVAVTIQIGFAVALPAVVVLIFGGQAIVALWLGGHAAYDAGLATFVFLSVLAFPAHSACSALLLAANRMQTTMAPILIVSASALLAVVVLAPVYGVAAVGLLLLCMEFANAAVTVRKAGGQFFAPAGVWATVGSWRLAAQALKRGGAEFRAQHAAMLTRLWRKSDKPSDRA